MPTSTRGTDIVHTVRVAEDCDAGGLSAEFCYGSAGDGFTVTRAHSAKCP
ncbi:MAG: hypothetical protein FWD58_05270 [Firmicutes bacterium]|nr:hypothetical protein [Bacillota bacterium]